MVGGKGQGADADCSGSMRDAVTAPPRAHDSGTGGRAKKTHGGRAQVGGDGQRAGPQVGQRVGPQVARVLGDGNEAVNVYAGERVPGQNFDCYAVRYGHKRGVFMNWRDTQQQTVGYKGVSLCGAMSVDDAVHYVRHGGGGSFGYERGGENGGGGSGGGSGGGGGNSS